MKKKVTIDHVLEWLDEAKASELYAVQAKLQVVIQGLVIPPQKPTTPA